MTNKELNEYASHKAFAKLTTLGFEADSLKEDIRTGNTGPITIDELVLLYEGTKKQIKIWDYIAKLIETDEQ
jgi:hypothetical protein